MELKVGLHEGRPPVALDRPVQIARDHCRIGHEHRGPELLGHLRSTPRQTQLHGNPVRVVVLPGKNPPGIVAAPEVRQPREVAAINGMITPVGHPEQSPGNAWIFGALLVAGVRHHLPNRRSSDEPCFAVAVGAPAPDRLVGVATAAQRQPKLGLLALPRTVHPAAGRLGDLQEAESATLLNGGEAVLSVEAQTGPVIHLRHPGGEISQPQRADQSVPAVPSGRHKAESDYEREYDFGRKRLARFKGRVPRVLDRLSGQQGGGVRRLVVAEDPRRLDRLVAEHLGQVAADARPVGIYRIPAPLQVRRRRGRVLFHRHTAVAGTTRESTGSFQPKSTPQVFGHDSTTWDLLQR